MRGVDCARVGLLNWNMIYQGRIIKLLEQLRVILVRLDDHLTAIFRDAPQFPRQIDAFFPAGNGGGRFRADARNFLQLTWIGAQDGGGVRKLLQQVAHRDPSDAADHV